MQNEDVKELEALRKKIEADRDYSISERRYLNHLIRREIYTKQLAKLDTK